MKSHKKLIFALILALLFVLTVFSSCNQKAEENAEYELKIVSGMLIDIEVIGQGKVDVTVPDGVINIIGSIFKNNKQIRSVTFPDGFRELSKECFSGCVSLERVVIPEGVTSIPVKAFYGCISLEEVNVPDSVTSVDRTAFSGCEKALKVEDGVYYIGNWAVDCRKDVFGITLREGTVGIADQAFMDRSELYYAVLPEGLLHLGDEAFKKSGILEILLPDSLITLGEGAFEYSELKKCRLPDGITRIPERCFYSSSLYEMEIPDSVVSIGQYALYKCGEWWGDAVWYFGNWLVGADFQVSSINHTVREGTVGIADGVFKEVYGSITLKLPEGVKYFGSECFRNAGGHPVKLSFKPGWKELDLSFFIGGVSEIDISIGAKIVADIKPNSTTKIFINSNFINYTWTVCINGEERELTYAEKASSEFITELICRTEGFEWLYGGTA